MLVNISSFSCLQIFTLKKPQIPHFFPLKPQSGLSALPERSARPQALPARRGAGTVTRGDTRVPALFPRSLLDRKFSDLRANTQLSLCNPMCVLGVFLSAYRKIWYFCLSVSLASPLSFSHCSGYFCLSYHSKNTMLSSLTVIAMKCCPSVTLIP